MSFNSALPLRINERFWILLVLAIVAVVAGLDVYFDFRAGSRARHILIEVFLGLIALAGFVFIAVLNFSMRRQVASLKSDLEHSRADAKQWKESSARHIAGLSAAIDEQFVRWGLTASEKEVALLVLKGLSHKEIALIRKTSERTVRQQALVVYAKSGLAGRAELSAFFLEDLLVPSTPLSTS